MARLLSCGAPAIPAPLAPALLVAALLLVAAVWQAPALAAEPAGAVTFAFGEARAVDPGGASRELRRGSPVLPGDLLVTGTPGRLQVRFSDGSFVSLIPGTRFRITAYRAEKGSGGARAALFDFLEGGFRTLTGLIGKAVEDRYEVRTPVATIGIRGTLYRATFAPESNKLLVSVGLDPSAPRAGIQLRAGGVVLPVLPGRSAVVEGAGAPPRLTVEQALVGLAEAAAGDGELADALERAAEDALELVASLEVTGADLAVGESDAGLPGREVEYDIVPFAEASGAFSGRERGDAEVIRLAPAGPADLTPSPFALVDAALLRDGAFVGELRVEGQPDLQDFREPTLALTGEMVTIDPLLVPFALDLLADAAVILSAAQLEALDQSLARLAADPARVADLDGAPNGLTWGRWTQGNLLDVEATATEFRAGVTALSGHQSRHWILGPRPERLPISGVARYGLAGGTSSTTLTGDTIGAGLTAGEVVVDFHSLAVSTSLAVSHGGAVEVSTSGSLFPGGLGFATVGSAAGGACGAGCDARVNGVLTNAGGGPVPDGLGAAYSLAPATGDTIHGVGGFGLTGYQPPAAP